MGVLPELVLFVLFKSPSWSSSYLRFHKESFGWSFLVVKYVKRSCVVGISKRRILTSPLRLALNAEKTENTSLRGSVSNRIDPESYWRVFRTSKECCKKSLFGQSCESLVIKGDSAAAHALDKEQNVFRAKVHHWTRCCFRWSVIFRTRSRRRQPAHRFELFCRQRNPMDKQG